MRVSSVTRQLTQLGVRNVTRKTTTLRSTRSLSSGLRRTFNFHAHSLRSPKQSALISEHGCRAFCSIPDTDRGEILGRLGKCLTQMERGKMIPPDGLTEELSLNKDLALDSLDMVEFVLECEEEFNIEIDDDRAETMETVGQAIDVISEILSAPVSESAASAAAAAE